jgi:hypothetical protein
VSIRLTDAGRALEGPACSVSAEMIDALAMDTEQFASLRNLLHVITERVSQPQAGATSA